MILKKFYPESAKKMASKRIFIAVPRVKHFLEKLPSKGDNLAIFFTSLKNKLLMFSSSFKYACNAQASNKNQG